MVEESSVGVPLKAFDCLGCGHCCQGRGGIIVAPQDLHRIADHLGLTPDEFITGYGERKGEKLVIRMGDDGYCFFYRQGVGCGVHVAKPDVCRAWPFFRGNLLDPVSLDLARDYCPGIAKDVSFAEFVKQGITYLQGEGIGFGGGPLEANALNIQDIIDFSAESASTSARDTAKNIPKK